MASYLQPLAKYADFAGRASRAEFWKFYLFSLSVPFIGGVFLSLAKSSGQQDLFVIILAAVLVFFVMTLVPLIAVGVRRLHDRGLTGWRYLLTLVPFVGLTLLVVFALKGTEGNNKYGRDPNAPLY